MKLAHNIKISVFSYPCDDVINIEKCLVSLCPFDLNSEKLSVSRSIATGFNEKKIIIFEILLIKEKHTSKFMQNLKAAISEEQRDLLILQVESRLDSELNFFIRLEKSKLLNDGKLWVADSGNCFHIKIGIAAYPSNRESALSVVKSWLS